jgi:hypothetical protein
MVCVALRAEIVGKVNASLPYATISEVMLCVAILTQEGFFAESNMNELAIVAHRRRE